MSATDKPDPIRGGQYLLDLLAEDEAERLDSLSDAERRAEAEREPGGLSRAPSADDIVARVKAVAARDPRPAAGRVVSASDAVEDPAPRSRVVPIRRSSRLVAVLAVAAAILIIFAVVKRPAIIAFFRGEHGIIGPLPPATPREMAEELRHNAVGRCEQGEFVACGDLLDHAAQLDPAGESEESVQKLRADIANANAQPQKKDKPDKPPP